MTTYFVTRHPATIRWAHAMAKHGRLPFAIDRYIDHLDVETLAKGDVVVGTLPVSVAGQLHARKIAYWSLDLDVPASERGKELSGVQLVKFGARLTRYEVREKDSHEYATQRLGEAKQQPSITLIPVSEQLVPAAIGWLHQPTEQVALLTSPRMKPQAKRLKAWLDARDDAPTTRILEWPGDDYASLLEQADTWATKLAMESRPQLVINLTGGTKPMAMALQRAFGKHRHSYGKALSGPYVDTEHGLIEDLLGEPATTVPMRSVLNISDMLSLQGLQVESAQSANPAFANWCQRQDIFDLLLSSRSSAWLGTWYKLLGLADDLVNPRRNKGGKRMQERDDLHIEWRGTQAEPEFVITGKKSKRHNWQGLKNALSGKFGQALQAAGVCDLALQEDTLTLRFDRTALDEFAFASGVWMEAWLATQFAAENVDEWAQGVSFKNKGVKNEFDLIALSGNRMLVAEVKTANLGRDGIEDSKATETVYKLDSVAQKLGRYFNVRWLVSLRPLPSSDIQRAQRHGIVVFHTGEPSADAHRLDDLPKHIRGWQQRCHLERDPAFTPSIFPAR